MRAGSAWAQTPPARHTHTHTQASRVFSGLSNTLPPTTTTTTTANTTFPSFLHHTSTHNSTPSHPSAMPSLSTDTPATCIRACTRAYAIAPSKPFPSGMAWLSGSAPVPDRQCVLIGHGSGIGRANPVSRPAEEIEIESMHVNQRFQAAIRPRRLIILAGRSCRLGSLGPPDHVTIKTSRPAPWLGPTLSCSVPEAAAPSTRDPWSMIHDP